MPCGSANSDSCARPSAVRVFRSEPARKNTHPSEPCRAPAVASTPAPIIVAARGVRRWWRRVPGHGHCKPVSPAVSALCRARRSRSRVASAFPQERRARGRHAHERTACRRVRHEESTVGRLFPHGQSRARGAPGFQRFLVGAFLSIYPLQQIEDQIFDRIAHGRKAALSRRDADFGGWRSRAAGRATPGGRYRSLPIHRSGPRRV
jgi:hypothetical protein